MYSSSLLLPEGSKYPNMGSLSKTRSTIPNIQTGPFGPQGLIYSGPHVAGIGSGLGLLPGMATEGHGKYLGLAMGAVLAAAPRFELMRMGLPIGFKPILATVFVGRIQNTDHWSLMS